MHVRVNVIRRPLNAEMQQVPAIACSPTAVSVLVLRNDQTDKPAGLVAGRPDVAKADDVTKGGGGGYAGLG